MNKKQIVPEFNISNNLGNDTFVGIKGENNKILIFLPECFVVSNNDDTNKKIKDTWTLLKCVKLSKLIRNDDSSNVTNVDNNNDAPIDSYIWLINDYKKMALLIMLKKLM